MTDDAIDTRLAALLGEPDLQPDERFVMRVERVILADQRLRAARRSAWQRFWREMAASGAVVIAFALLWSVGPAVSIESVSIAPALAAVTLLALWFLVVLRPAVTQG